MEQKGKKKLRKIDFYSRLISLCRAESRKEIIKLYKKKKNYFGIVKKKKEKKKNKQENVGIKKETSRLK